MHATLLSPGQLERLEKSLTDKKIPPKQREKAFKRLLKESGVTLKDVMDSYVNTGGQRIWWDERGSRLKRSLPFFERLYGSVQVFNAVKNVGLDRAFFTEQPRGEIERLEDRTAARKVFMANLLNFEELARQGKFDDLLRFFKANNKLYTKKFIDLLLRQEARRARENRRYSVAGKATFETVEDILNRPKGKLSRKERKAMKKLIIPLANIVQAAAERLEINPTQNLDAVKNLRSVLTERFGKELSQTIFAAAG